MRAFDAGDPERGGSAERRGTDAWLDAFEEMIAELERRDVETELDFEDVTVDVPLRMREDAEFARVGLDGTVRVRVANSRRPLVEWLRWWRRQRQREER